MPLPSPFVYRYVFDYGASLSTGNYTLKDPEKEFTKSRLPGAEIMRSLAKVRRSGDTERQLVEGLFMTFTEECRSRGWTWQPGVPCKNAKVVDGEATAVECAGYAAGMFCLARAPIPFGLNIPEGDGTGATVRVEPYNGADKRGFVSFHPPEGVLGLPPNVYTAVGAALPGNLRNRAFYLWSNHKVVRYANHLFDPTYGCQYENLAEMACLQIVDWEVLGGTKPSSIELFDKKGATDTRGRYLYICEDPVTMVRFYIRFTPTSLRGSDGLFDGPYTKSQRDELAKTVGGEETTGAAVSADTVFGYPA